MFYRFFFLYTNLFIFKISKKEIDKIYEELIEHKREYVDEIVKIAVEKFLAANESIPGSKDEIVAAAYSRAWIVALKDTPVFLLNE